MSSSDLLSSFFIFYSFFFLQGQNCFTPQFNIVAQINLFQLQMVDILKNF